jgi:hypothetical protein
MRRMFHVIVELDVEADSEEQAIEFVRENASASGSVVRVEGVVETSN